MARCQCGGGGCNCVVVAGPGVAVTGAGSTPNPYVISAETDCAEVRGCISAGPGAVYDPATGVIGADISDTPGNNLTVDSGGLFVPTGAATVSTACGLAGDGSASAPLEVVSEAWPYACDIAVNGGDVYCDPATNALKTDPPVRYDFFGTSVNSSPSTPITVPSGVQQTIQTVTLTVTNPDPCRTAHALYMREVDLDFDLPPNSGAASGVDGAETGYFGNRGTTLLPQAHALATRLSEITLAPGETRTLTMDITAGRGSGGATIATIKGAMRAWIFSNPS